MARLEVVLLDVDGTLVDSNDAHARSWLAALAEVRREVPYGRIRQLIGVGSDKLLVAATGLEPGSMQGNALVERRKKLFLTQYLSSVRAFPGARALLQRFRRDGLRLVVATSAGEAEMSALLALAGASDLVDARTSSDDAERSKPDPDIVQAALRVAGVNAAQALLLGDTPYDVQGARRAGVRTVALTSGGWHHESLGGALAVYRDPADLLARYDSSPFAQR